MWMQCSKIFEKQSKEIKQCLAADRKAGKAPRLIIVEKVDYRLLGRGPAASPGGYAPCKQAAPFGGEEFARKPSAQSSWQGCSLPTPFWARPINFNL
jgi:hypothetical protein